MLLGANKTDITPGFPIDLAGFAHREGLATTVENHLFIKTFYFELDETKMLMIIADLIWWGDQLVSELQNEIEVGFSIPKEHICFHATHNHSGPQTSFRFSKQLGETSIKYVRFLKGQVIQSVQKAIEDVEKVSMDRRSGTSKLGIYRRKRVDNQIVRAPNRKVPTDNELSIISFKTEENRTKAIWIHYSCHPTTTDANVVSSEYPGVCSEEVEKFFPGATVAFLQGFCADVRPALVKDHEFYRGTLEEMKEVGKRFANEVLDVLESGKKYSFKGALKIKNITLPLIFEETEIEAYIPDELKEEWPKLVEKNWQDGYELKLQYIQLGDQLSFLSCNAELSQAYGTFIKKIDPHILPLGYANGMVGYVPTKKQLYGGGYEPIESIFYFGLPAMLAYKIEEKIQATFEKILGGEK